MYAHAVVLFLRYVFLDAAFDIVRFPLWWYGAGGRRVFTWYGESILYMVERLAFIVLLKNLATPMFGDYSRQGRAISFGVRLMLLLGSFALFLVWLAWQSFTLIGYLLLPPAVLIFIRLTYPHG